MIRNEKMNGGRMRDLKSEAKEREKARGGESQQETRERWREREGEKDREWRGEKRNSSPSEIICHLSN